MKRKSRKFKASKTMGGLSDKEAQVVGLHLDKLAAKLGNELTPTEIVDDAAKARSPIHKYFDWDDTEAARKYRLQQARMLTKYIVEVTFIKGTPVVQKSFFNVKNEVGDRVYVTMVDVVENEDYLQQVIKEAQRYIASFNRVLDTLYSHVGKRRKKK